LAILTPKNAWSILKTNGTKTNLCSSAIDSFQKKQVSRKFNHDPFQMIESLIQIANGEYSEAKKNLSVELSFDLSMVYGQTQRLHQGSKLFKDPYMTKIKTNFFGLFNQLYKKPAKSLLIRNGENLTSLDVQKIQSGSILFTKLGRSACTREESTLLGCSSGYYIVDAIISPEISCSDESLKNAFKAMFYLTHSKKFGFKITDVEMSGSRVVLQTFLYVQELKKRGYRKDAILARFKNLQNSSSSFKFPSRLNHSRSILAIIESNNNRVPTSL
jgi:hypothetical protein